MAASESAQRIQATSVGPLAGETLKVIVVDACACPRRRGHERSRCEGTRHGERREYPEEEKSRRGSSGARANSSRSATDSDAEQGPGDGARLLAPLHCGGRRFGPNGMRATVTDEVARLRRRENP